MNVYFCKIVKEVATKCTSLRWVKIKINLPRKVLKMYSEIWFPDFDDSEKWLNSLFSILLNCKKKHTNIKLKYLDKENDFFQFYICGGTSYAFTHKKPSYSFCLHYTILYSTVLWRDFSQSLYISFVKRMRSRKLRIKSSQVYVLPRIQVCEK